jgi:hypothetical protein
MLNETELKAIELSNDPKRLLKRLKEAKKCLNKEYLVHFKNAKFDFEGKRLVGNNNYILQWLLRHNPNLPPDYDNQQTNQGVVYCIEVSTTF